MRTTTAVGPSPKRSRVNFDSYQVGPYAAGPQYVLVPYSPEGNNQAGRASGAVCEVNLNPGSRTDLSLSTFIPGREIESNSWIVCNCRGRLFDVVGLLIYSGGFNWFGKLPGDIRYESARVHFYAPIVSMLLVSVALSLIFYLFAGSSK